MDRYLSARHRNVQKDWVRRNNIQAPFQSGAMVKAAVGKVRRGSRRVSCEEAFGRAYIDERSAKTAKCQFRDPEWIEENGDQGGYVVDSNNPISLCKAIDKASEISDRELSEWNNDIRKKTLMNYSWDNIAKLTLNFYNEIRSI